MVFARDWGVHTSQPVIGPALVVVCAVMVAAAALVYRFAALGSVWTVPRAALRAVAPYPDRRFVGIGCALLGVVGLGTLVAVLS